MKDSKTGNSFIPAKITKDQARDTGMAMVLISLLFVCFSQKNNYIDFIDHTAVALHDYSRNLPSPG